MESPVLIWTAFVAAACGLGFASADYGIPSSLGSCSCSNSSIHQVVDIPLSIAAPIPSSRPFQRMVRVGDLVHLTAVTGLDLLTSVIVPGGARAEALKCMQNIRTLLALVGCDLGNIHSLTELILSASDIVPSDQGISQAFADAGQPEYFSQEQAFRLRSLLMDASGPTNHLRKNHRALFACLEVQHCWTDRFHCGQPFEIASCELDSPDASLS